MNIFRRRLLNSLALALASPALALAQTQTPAAGAPIRIALIFGVVLCIAGLKLTAH